MWFTGIANYEGGLAHYNIIQEKEGLYHAILVKYDGKPTNKPPSNIILVRGMRHWSGSVEDENLLNQLGTVIDTRIRGRLYGQIQKENKDKKGKRP